MLFTEIKNGTDKKKLKHNKHWVQTKPGLNNDAKKKTTSLQKDNIVKVMFMRFIEAASASNLGSYIKDACVNESILVLWHFFDY